MALAKYRPITQHGEMRSDPRRRDFETSADDVPSGPPEGAVSPWVRLRSANMHPFIYARMVRDADPMARPGDVVNVYDRSGSLFGRGFYNPHSIIRLRILTHADHPIDDAFWRSRLSMAVELRSRLRLSDVTDAYRLVHAEGDGLSGLIVERYADCLVFEIFSLGMVRRLEMLSRLLPDLLGSPTSLDRPGRANERWRIVIRTDESVEKMESFKLSSELPSGLAVPSPAQITIREHGVRYRVDPAGGHKTGFFCDQRDNRRRFAELCNGGEVLDLCCYTGGFSLCAKLLGDANEVTAVDLDEAAVALAKENANLNQARIQFVHADAFVYLRQMIANQRQFDAVVLDPPKLAGSRTELEEALRKYSDLNTLALQAVKPGGFLTTCSCSGLVSRDQFAEVVCGAARRARMPVQILDYTGAGPDHPVMANCPESGYLKAMWLRRV